MADVTPELRRQIFELAALGRPRTQIARDLGISEGSVRYQLDKPAKAAAAGAVSGLPDTRTLTEPPGLLPDPLADARRSLALEQIEAQKVSLRAQRQEAERRLEMLSKAPGDSNGAILLVMGELREMRERLNALATHPAPAAAAPAPIYEQLGQLKNGWEAVQAIAGDQKAPTTEAELAARVALDRLNLEGEERRRRLDFELEDLRQKRRNDEIRAEAWAEQVRQWGPILMQGAQGWFAQQQASGNGTGGEGASNGAGAPVRSSGGGQLVQLPGGAAVQPAALGMVEGPCPNCGAPLRFRPSPGDDGTCPQCAMPLAVVEGKIWPKISGRNGGNAGALPSIAG